jgi:circadian clock protein KaiB
VSRRKNPRYVLRLYIAGDGPNSTLARANAQDIIARHLVGRCSIEVVDVQRDASRALADEVFVTPTLIRVVPGPRRQIVGNLSERDKVLRALGV